MRSNNHPLASLVVSVVLLAAGAPSFSAAAARSGVQAHGTVPRDSYGQSQMRFEANRGQTDPRVEFVSRGSGYTLFLTATEAVLALHQSPATLRVQLVGANPSPRLQGLIERPGLVSYFVGNDAAGWRTGIPTFEKVRYEAVYPGVDLVYYGNQQQLEYDFVVAPGGDPTLIRLRLVNAEKLQVDDAGNLVVEMAGGRLSMRKPVIYQKRDGRREEVAGSYVLLDPDGGDPHPSEVGFRLSGYDARRPLVIDPVIHYSTYLGGSADDAVYETVVDAAGNTYLAGYTSSLNYPTDAGAAQSAHAGGFYDAVVTKLDPDGALVYSTYLGGSGSDFGFQLAVDAGGSVHLAGTTNSANFPTTAGAAQPLRGGQDDVFLARLNAAGTALLYSTYLGGSLQEAVSSFFPGSDLVLDASGNAIVAGHTYSANFPTTNAAQPTFGGGTLDVFVTKFDAGGTVVYSTYLGGSGLESALRFAVDPAGNAYAAGSTGSSNFPTANAVQSTFHGGPSFDRTDAFVTKLSPTGAFVYSTYLGGSGFDTNFGTGSSCDFAVDAGGNAYITGFMSSMDFPVANAMQPVAGSDRDVFLTRLDPGGQFVYSTYVGGNGMELLPRIAADANGNVYLAVETASTNLPSLNAVQPGPGGSYDTYVLKLNASGAPVYSTYLGGSRGDSPGKIVADASGNAYVLGSTQSSDFPTANPAQATLRGGNDVFVAKLNGIGALVYSTYLGGSTSSSESGRDLELDTSGNAYIIGATTSLDFPTVRAVQSSYGGGSPYGVGDAFVTKLDATGGFAYSTYLGGNGDDRALYLAVDASGRAHVAGFTTSTDLPTVNAVQPSFGGGNSDSFATTIADDGPPTAAAGGPYAGDEGGPIPVDGSGSGDDEGIALYEWDCEDDGSFDASSADPTGSSCTYPDDGAFTLRLRVTDDAGQTATGTASVIVANVAPTATFTTGSSPIIQGQALELAFSDPHDPGADDTLAGFEYAYDCDGDSVFEVLPSPAPSHTCSYPIPGPFTAAGRILDKDGGATDYQVAVVVLDARQGIDLLIEKVNELVASGLLRPGPAGGLIAKLEAAAQQLDKGQTNATVNQLEAFINQVNGLVATGQLSSTDGQLLIDCASQIVAALGG
jgi:hypothetical protein